MPKLIKNAMLAPWLPNQAQRKAGARDIDPDWLLDTIRTYGLHCAEWRRLEARGGPNDAEHARYRKQSADETLELIEKTLSVQAK